MTPGPSEEPTPEPTESPAPSVLNGFAGLLSGSGWLILLIGALILTAIAVLVVIMRRL